ncbi:FAD-dependent oxidoreductase [Paracoccus aerius]
MRPAHPGDLRGPRLRGDAVVVRHPGRRRGGTGRAGPAPNFRRSQAMLDKAAAFLPGLRTTGGKQWMGFRPSLPDSLPAIGPLPGHPHVICAFGHGHLGLTQSGAPRGSWRILPQVPCPPSALRPFRLRVSENGHDPIHLPLHRRPHLRQPRPPCRGRRTPAGGH